MAHAVGREENAGADLADLRRLFVNRDPDALRDQRVGREQAANPATDNRDMRAGFNHHRLLCEAGAKLRRCIVTRTKASCHQTRPIRRNNGRYCMQSGHVGPRIFAARHAIALSLLLALATSISPAARAENYPDRPVKIIVPFAAGGTADAIPRFIGDWLSRRWGQPVIIENRTGAAGNIGSDFVYHSAPDGYTLLSSPPPPLVINQSLYPKLGFDPGKFTPIIVMAQVPNALIVNPDNVKASNLAELLDYLKQNPDKVTAATQGNGTTSHLTSELFQLMAKVKLRQIPYRGSSPALQGLLAGDVDLMFDNLGVSLP